MAQKLRVHTHPIKSFPELELLKPMNSYSEQASNTHTQTHTHAIKYKYKYLFI